jgi:type IV secretion system protein TrbB
MNNLDINNEVTKQRELDNIRNNLKELLPYLNNPKLTDIFCSSSGEISIKCFGQDITDTSTRLSLSTRFLILNQIAKYMKLNINFIEYPVLEATIPVPEWKNSRITGIYPPWEAEPSFTIRKPPERIYTLEEYVENKQLPETYYDLIITYLKNKKNIIIAGSTGSGKTTLVNALIKKKVEFFPNERYYIVQDVSELQCRAKYATMPILPTEQAIKAVLLSLRYSPNTIIFGEVRRGNVMAEILDAWNTGHPGGITTIHSNSSALTLTRIRKLLLDYYSSEQALPDLYSYIDLIIYIQKNNTTGIFISEIMEMAKKKTHTLDNISIN